MSRIWPLASVPTDFPAWVCERYPNAVAHLRKVNDGTIDFWRYAWLCIESAEIARAWDRARTHGELDPNESARRADAAFLESAAHAREAARTLAAHLERPSSIAAWHVSDASSRLNKYHPNQRVKFDTGSPATALAQLLREYVTSTERWHLARKGPFAHRTTVGALDYGAPVDDRTLRSTMISSSLLFSLVVFARNFTSKEAFLLCAGCRMPNFGKPLWAVAVAFLADALNEHITENQAQDRISKLVKRHSQLSWVGWPQPPMKSLDTPNPDTWW